MIIVLWYVLTRPQSPSAAEGHLNAIATVSLVCHNLVPPTYHLLQLTAGVIAHVSLDFRNCIRKAFSSKI